MKKKTKCLFRAVIISTIFRTKHQSIEATGKNALFKRNEHENKQKKNIHKKKYAS